MKDIAVSGQACKSLCSFTIPDVRRYFIYALFCYKWIQTSWRTRIRVPVLYIHSSYRRGQKQSTNTV